MNEIEKLRRQAVVYCLIDQLRKKGNWCGETHVQKTMFFLDELAGHAVGYEFILYKHGPFSFALSEDLSVMDALHYLQDEIVNINYGLRLRANPSAEKMFTVDFGQIALEVNDCMNFVTTKLADYGVATLERLGTALYFTLRERVEGQEARAQKIHEIKPHITDAQALDAVKKVEAILDEWTAMHAPNRTNREKVCSQIP